MNLFRTFESRVSDVFGAAPQGYTAPFSFKRLAKSAAKQMEAETFVIDGVDTAPALYTVLVSPADDAAMRLLYPTLTQELVEFVKGQADAKGYAFVGEPLARFLTDPKLRSGKFAVFAENVDSLTLERLRAEEQAFLQGSSAVGGAAADRLGAHSAAARPARRPAHAEPQVMPNLDLDLDLDEDVSPFAPVGQPVAAVAVNPLVASADPDEVIPIPAVGNIDDDSLGLDIVPTDFLDEQISASQLAVPEVDVPMTVRRTTPVQAPSVDDPLPAEDEGTDPVTCLLVDRQTGRTYVGTAPVTAIGRERTAGGITLSDPNVSRRHAELTFDGSAWHIRDLGSTNGTLVNDMDIAQTELHDGDLLTIGLMNLEFREG